MTEDELNEAGGRRLLAGLYGLLWLAWQLFKK